MRRTAPSATTASAHAVQTKGWRESSRQPPSFSHQVLFPGRRGGGRSLPISASGSSRSTAPWNGGRGAQARKHSPNPRRLSIRLL